MSENKELSAQVALERLFGEIMQLQSGDKILAVMDASTYPVIQPFCDAAMKLKLDFIISLCPISFQRTFNEFNRNIPDIHQRLFEDVHGILTMVTEAPGCTAFRINIIKTAISKNPAVKIVHMPGIDINILAASNSIRFKEVMNVSIKHSKILSDGKEVKIVTQESSGKHHELTFSINGRSGHADKGIVEKGEMINFPSGEAYIAPIEGTAEGSIVINGSVPNIVLDNRNIILYFKNGVLDAKRTHAANEIFTTEFMKSVDATAKLDGGKSYYLAEFGIGCNSGYTNLIGRPLVDEKMAGTIHIALGSNKILGGIIEASSHNDLIAYPKEVYIDNKSITLPSRRQ